MMETDRQADRYRDATRLLPESVRRRALLLEERGRAAAEELRLRVGRPLAVLLPEGERELGTEAVTGRELSLLIELATGASAQSSRRELSSGYIACRGGHRVGLCGSVYLENGHMAGFSACSSAAVRIAREKRGVAGGLLPGLFRDGQFRSTLICAPPGAGKTTLLRELVRVLASPSRLYPTYRVSLCDERGELAAMWDGAPQLDVGERTDVLDGCPKSEAVMAVLRAMNPQIVALDEITDPADTEAVFRARNCGVALLATAHAGSLDDLRARPLYRDMLSGGVFENFILIKRTGGEREYQLTKGEVGLC